MQPYITRDTGLTGRKITGRKIQRATSFYQALQQNAFKTNLYFLIMLFIKVGFKETFYSRYTSILQVLTLNKKYQGF